MKDDGSPFNGVDFDFDILIFANNIDFHCAIFCQVLPKKQKYFFFFNPHKKESFTPRVIKPRRRTERLLNTSESNIKARFFISATCGQRE